MGNKHWFDKLQMWVIGGAIATLIVTLILVVYSIGTISSELYKAFSPAQSSAPTVEFNLSGYDSLGLK